MTTFAQWRSPSSRLETGRLDVTPRKYDIRVVDQFYSYCQTVSRTDQQRAAAARSLQTAKLKFWRVLVAGSLLSYYVVERVAQAMSLY
jgi:hypothetical protein